MSYLYGLSVQGIQDFIFKTNQLQEIIGASEIIKGLENEIGAYHPTEILLNAAGNIKVIFKDKASVESVVKALPKQIMQKAYGITVSQAVVTMEEKFAEQKEALEELERKLKIQRNKPTIPLDLSINIMELAPKTARPLVKIEKKGKDEIKMDMSTMQKCKANPDNKGQLSDLKNSKGKIAVIHADGNGLGQLIPKLSNIPVFSQGLDEATEQAFEEAKTVVQNGKIRKIILGGDDMTVICDATYALEFTRVFLDAFEQQTLAKTGHKLTACAGIAFCNEKYPFHYAVSLAEALCSATKKHAKDINPNLAPSSLMFHNIQSSNFQSWEKFVKDELTITNDKETIRCDFGPYYLSQEGQPQIANFLNTVEAYRCEGSPISRLREWLGELGKSKTYADNLLKRINEMASQNRKWDACVMNNNLKQFKQELTNENLTINKDGHKKTPIYDVLQILSVTEAKQ